MFLEVAAVTQRCNNQNVPFSFYFLDYSHHCIPDSFISYLKKNGGYPSLNSAHSLSSSDVERPWPIVRGAICYLMWIDWKDTWLSEMPGRVDCPPSHFVCGEVHPSEEGEPDGWGFYSASCSHPRELGSGRSSHLNENLSFSLPGPWTVRKIYSDKILVAIFLPPIPFSALFNSG